MKPTHPPPTIDPRATAQPALQRGLGWFTLGAIGLLFITVSIQKICNPDLWWQLRTGQLVLEQGWPTVDTLSYTAAGNEWIEMRWIFCVLAYLTWKAGGPAAIILGHAAVCAAVFIIFCWRSRRTLFTLPGLVTLALGLATAQNRFTIRPEIMTYLFSALALVILDGATRPEATARDRRLLWLLPVIQVVWTNSHTVFIFGPIFAWAFAGGDFVHRYLRRVGLASHTKNPHKPGSMLDVPLVLAAIGVTAACWVNPYFHRGAMFPFLLYSQTMSGDIAKVIQELAAPLEIPINLWSPDMYVSIVLVAWSAGVLAAGFVRFNLVRLGLWAAMLFLFARSIRNIGPFGLVAMWACLRTLDDLRDAPVFRRFGESLGRSGVVRAARAAAVLALAAGVLYATWYVATNRLARSGRSARQFGVGIVPWIISADAVRWIREHKPLGPILHSLDDGAYLSFAAPEYKIWVDGRLEVYGNRIFELIDPLSMAIHWREFTAKHGFNTILLHREQQPALFDPILADPAWVLVHMDPRALVFVRDIPEHASIIASQRIDPYAPWTPRTPPLEQHPPEWARRLGAVSFSWYWLGLALDFLRLRALDNCQIMLERAHAEFPDDKQAALLLAQMYHVRGRAAEAEALEKPYEGRLIPEEIAWKNNMLGAMRQIEAAAREASAPGAPPPNALMFLAQAEEAQKRGDWAAAAEHYRRIVDMKPDNWGAWARLANCYDQLNRPADAAFAYRGLTIARPGQWQAYYNVGRCLVETGDLAGAKAAFEETLRLNPDSADARIMLEHLKAAPAPATIPGGGAAKP